VIVKNFIYEIKGFPILDGYRGKPKADIKAIVETLMKISKLVTEHEEINEMDLNPVFIYDKDLICVDARIILKKGSE
jgi:acyl-CoA synthetase (NDP forming)